MPAVFNVFGDDWDGEIPRPGGSFQSTQLGPRVGAGLLGASLYELRPSEKGWPYHFHHGNEELLVVLSGTPTLRAPDGERTLAAGDCVLFRRGPDGAHTVRNDSAEPARFLMFSTRIAPELITYPDSGKLGAASVFGRHIFREDSGVGYWEGEE